LLRLTLDVETQKKKETSLRISKREVADSSNMSVAGEGGETPKKSLLLDRFFFWDGGRKGKRQRKRRSLLSSLDTGGEKFPTSRGREGEKSSSAFFLKEKSLNILREKEKKETRPPSLPSLRGKIHLPEAYRPSARERGEKGASLHLLITCREEEKKGSGSLSICFLLPKGERDEPSFPNQREGEN